MGTEVVFRTSLQGRCRSHYLSLEAFIYTQKLLISDPLALRNLLCRDQDIRDVTKNKHFKISLTICVILDIQTQCQIMRSRYTCGMHVRNVFSMHPMSVSEHGQSFSEWV